MIYEHRSQFLHKVKNLKLLLWMDVANILQKGRPSVFYSPHPYGYDENMNKLHKYRFGIGCGRATPVLIRVNIIHAGRYLDALR